MRLVAAVALCVSLPGAFLWGPPEAACCAFTATVALSTFYFEYRRRRSES